VHWRVAKLRKWYGTRARNAAVAAVEEIENRRKSMREWSCRGNIIINEKQRSVAAEK
jgi:hypothetical protein